MDAFSQLLDFLARLTAAQIHFSLASIRPDTIAVLVTVPGERWEVEFFADGRLEVEVFRAVGAPGETVGGPEALERLFAEFGEPVPSQRSGS